MLANGRTLPLLLTAPPHTLSCEDLEHSKACRRSSLAETRPHLYEIAARWAAGCIPGSTLVVVSHARHLLPVDDETTFAGLVLEWLA